MSISTLLPRLRGTVRHNQQRTRSFDATFALTRDELLSVSKAALEKVDGDEILFTACLVPIVCYSMYHLIPVARSLSSPSQETRGHEPSCNLSLASTSNILDPTLPRCDTPLQFPSATCQIPSLHE